MKEKMIDYDAVVFDLDGTLLDSLQGIADAGNLLLAHLGYAVYDRRVYCDFIGDGVLELVRRMLPVQWHDLYIGAGSEAKEIVLAQLVVRWRDFYHETWRAGSVPFAGIVELLAALSQRGIPMGILSNKSHDFTRQMTAEIFSLDLFEAVVGSRPGVPLKPDPRVLLEIVTGMGVTPERTLFVGDSGIDMQTAVNAGMVPLGVGWGFRPESELIAYGAKRIISRPEELVYSN